MTASWGAAGANKSSGLRRMLNARRIGGVPVDFANHCFRIVFTHRNMCWPTDLLCCAVTTPFFLSFAPAPCRCATGFFKWLAAAVKVSAVCKQQTELL